jgi:hypothetical protein
MDSTVQRILRGMDMRRKTGIGKQKAEITQPFRR